MVVAARACRLADMPPPPRIFVEMEAFGGATGSTDVRACFRFGESKHPPPPPVSLKTPETIDDLLIPLTGEGTLKAGALAAAVAELVERGIGDAQANEADPC